MNPNELTLEFILGEIKKLQYLYGLKHEIRYGQSRPEGDLTESVAEHIYGMHLLIHYFLPLENPAGDWDTLRIFSMATMHDFDEIETGDIIAYLKTPEQSALELEAGFKVIANAPAHVRDTFSSHLTEYNERQSIESRFVKAIDVFEPLVQMYNEFGRAIIAKNQQGSEQAFRLKNEATKPFPIMHAYFQAIHNAMIREGFFLH